MKTKALKAFAGFALVLMVLSIIPSGAFAAEENTVAEDSDTVRPGKMMGNMSTAKGPDGMPGMQRMAGGSQMLAGEGLALLEDLDEDNFSEIQADILERLENQTERLGEMKDRCLEDENEEMAEELEARIAELEAFYEEVEGASSAEELEAVIFAHIKENRLEGLEGQIERLEEIKAELDETGDTDRIEKLEEQISELQALYEAVSGAEDLEDFEEIKFSSEKEKMLEMLEMQISRLEEKLENYDENENHFFSEEDLETRISELEELKEAVNDAESQEDLLEVKDTFSLGGPAGPEEGRGPRDGKGPAEGRGPTDGRGPMDGRGSGNIPVEEE